MNKILYAISAAFALSLTGCVTYTAVPAPKENYGLTINSSFNEKPVRLSEETPALVYNKRLYYFQNKDELNQFKEMPDLYLMKYNFNEQPHTAIPLASDYGLRTNCAYSGDQMVVRDYTPAATYMDRIYYFASPQSRDKFLYDPQASVARFAANQAPRTVSPLKSDYSSKAACAVTGAPILVGPHTPAVEYMGRIFYFSDLKAMETFQHDPQKYITLPFNQELQTN